MMKKLLLALALICGTATANATEYWVAPTEAGGQIVLTFDKTGGCGDTLYFMYTVFSNQEVVYGCWTAINQSIHVRYDNGVRRVYSTTGWVRKDGL